ncbi:peptidoglycan DD-metalloendopeptidase family protein [Oscillatoria sp. FACHB-1406]|uniref:peptidoglycan DD-metalloendopeptidase family protein n=1 Tax=Oscillatoria sp. FACHB-1406 TaxID=2692846 RepID=UPI0019B99784|nr:peptidoglycan DD-metalloendopeptidase family protein [Oscillatoria sp. FACHB-1406]MBD2580300.1 M23 family metallopeptidase [Oscillatoria sp. FACHB-1406]
MGLALSTVEPNINRAIKVSPFGRFFAQFPIPALRSPSQQAKLSLDWNKTPKVGDAIAGYRVTSGYGPRTKPCPTCSSYHPAIDVGTPVGTPLHAIADTTVKCWQDANGGGLVGEYALPNRTIVQLLHLSDCKGGNAKTGDVIAKSGNSGIGSGAHVDVRLKPRSVIPPTELVERTLTGKTPSEKNPGLKLAILGEQNSKPKGIKPLFVLPARGTLTRGLDKQKHLTCSVHCGVDIANAEGTPVQATAEGEVVFAGEDEYGLGMAIQIAHGGGMYSVYGHNSKLLVRVGDRVRQGQQIALMGKTGKTKASNLHFELRWQNNAVPGAKGMANQWLDPLEVLDFSEFPRAKGVVLSDRTVDGANNP